MRRFLPKLWRLSVATTAVACCLLLAADLQAQGKGGGGGGGRGGGGGGGGGRGGGGGHSMGGSRGGGHSMGGSRGGHSMGSSRGYSGHGSHSGHGYSGHGHSGHGGSHSYHGGSSRYYGGSGRNYSRGGYSYFGISPYGARYGYYGSGFGISIGSYYRPGYPYYRYGSGSGYYGYPSNYYYGYPSSGYYGSYGYATPSYSSGYGGAPVYVESAPPVVIEGNTGSRIVEVQPDGSTVPLGQNAGGQAYSSAKPIAGQRGPVVTTNEKAAPFELQAEQAFRERRYADARRHVEHAQLEDAENGQLTLFESQILFALGEFEASAAALRKGTLQSGPDDWGYVVDNYDRLYTGNDYVDQMNRLLSYTEEHPDAAYAHMLQGYHYLYLGHKDAAAKKLRRAVALEGSDGLAAELLAAAGGAETSKALPPPPPLPGPVPDVEAVDDAANTPAAEANDTGDGK